MALVLADRVRDTTATTGTGTVTLSGTAPTGYQNFSVIGNGNTTYYTINGDTQWEVGIGTYTSSGTTLSRNTVLASSNGGSLVDFAAGTKDVFVTYPSEKAVTEDYGNALAATTAANLAGGAAGSIPYQTAANTTAMLATGTGVLIGGTTPSYTASPSLTQVTVAADPTANLQVATKQYVDGLVASGITYHEPVKYEVPNSTGNLNATYNQPGGAGVGVGATLTNAGTLAAFAPDGPTAQIGDRILVYNQTSAFQNGIYTVTTVGSGSVAWVLTRATDADTYGLKDTEALGNGDSFFVSSGDTGAGETYVCNTAGTIVFGSTAITFVQVSDATLYTAGNGLQLTSGTVFSLIAPVTTVNGGTGLTSFTSGGAVYATSSSALTTGTLPATAGGTGNSSFVAGDLLYATSSTAIGRLADVATGNALISGGVGADPSYGKIGLTTHISGTLAVGNGGTGATTLTGYLVGNGTSAFTATATIPTSALSGTISLTTQVSGTLGAGNGGTGISSYTVGDILYASATTTLSSLADVATGNALISGGVSNPPSWGKIGLTTHVSGTLPVSNGGSGATTLTGYLKGNGTSAFTASATIPSGDITGAALTKADDTNVTLTLGGSPSTALLAATSITAGWSGQLAVSRGGTGNSTLASGYLLKGNGVSPTSASVIYDDGTNVGIGNAAIPYVTSGRTVLNVNGTSSALISVQSAGTNRGYFYGDGAIVALEAESPCTLKLNAIGAQPMTFFTSNTERLTINSSGNVTANVDFRAPIFYDSANTSYYLDPTGSTSLNTAGNLITSGNLTLSNGANRYVRIGSATNYSYDLQTTGDDFQIIEAGVTPRLTIKYPSGNVGIGTTSPLAKLHTVASTPTGIGALPSGVTGILDSSGNNYLLFRHTADNATYSGIAFQDNNMGGYVVFGNYGANPSDQLAIAGYNGGILQYGTSDTINPALRTTVASWNSTGLQINNGDMRAPIYYDSNNTAYYVDPNSTSRIVRLVLDNGDNLSWGGVYGAGIPTIAASTSNGLYFYPTGSTAGNTFTMFSSYAIATGSMRAPIFYDSDNTAFFVDPNSTSVLSVVRAATIQHSSGNRAITLNGSTWTEFCDPNGVTKLWLGQSGDPNNYYNANIHYFRNNGSGTTMTIDSAGTVIATADMRAPIFYDSGNTGYYVDPASTSNLNVLQLQGSITTINGFSPANSAIRLTPNLHLNATAGNAIILNWDNGTTSGLTFRIGNGAGSDVFTTYANGAVYASIIYDISNSAYYVDPASTTALNGLTVGGYFVLRSPGTINGNIDSDYGEGFVTFDPVPAGTPPISSPNIRTINVGNNFSRRTQLAYTYDTDRAWFRRRNDGGWGGWYEFAVFGNPASAGALYGTIYYDGNNTAYYLDPGSTGISGMINGEMRFGGGGNSSVITTDGDFYSRRKSATTTGVYYFADGGTKYLFWDGGRYLFGSAGPVDSDSSFRAPIFYDLNDTSYYMNLNGYSQINGNGSVNGSAGVGMSIFSTGGNGAIMSFHRSGLYAVNIGLDSDNVIRIGGWSAAANRLQMDMSGNLTMAGNVTAYSDARLKKDVETIGDALGLVRKMRGVTYTRIDTDKAGVGVIAQEMLEVMPQAVQQGIGDDDTLSVAYGNLVGVLIEAIKELEARVAELEGK
jgi:hypothetical protein